MPLFVLRTKQWAFHHSSWEAVLTIRNFLFFQTNCLHRKATVANLQCCRVDTYYKRQKEFFKSCSKFHFSKRQQIGGQKNASVNLVLSTLRLRSA